MGGEGEKRRQPCCVCTCMFVSLGFGFGSGDLLRAAFLCADVAVAAAVDGGRVAVLLATFCELFPFWPAPLHTHLHTARRVFVCAAQHYTKSQLTRNCWG